MQTSPDPATEWAGHLNRLDGARRDAVVAALRHSAATGWPASEAGVELLVAYALGEITSQQYARGLMRSWGGSQPGPAVESVAPRAQRPPPPPEPVAEPVAEPTPRMSREQAVQAYVTGQIDVGEFLRIART